jgi:hypothetical protein
MSKKSDLLWYKLNNLVLVIATCTTCMRFLFCFFGGRGSYNKFASLPEICLDTSQASFSSLPSQAFMSSSLAGLPGPPPGGLPPPGTRRTHHKGLPSLLAHVPFKLCSSFGIATQAPLGQPEKTHLFFQWGAPTPAIDRPPPLGVGIEAHRGVNWKGLGQLPRS